jgi:hypothetical protein
MCCVLRGGARAELLGAVGSTRVPSTARVDVGTCCIGVHVCCGGDIDTASAVAGVRSDSEHVIEHYMLEFILGTHVGVRYTKVHVADHSPDRRNSHACTTSNAPTSSTGVALFVPCRHPGRTSRTELGQGARPCLFAHMRHKVYARVDPYVPHCLHMGRTLSSAFEILVII